MILYEPVCDRECQHIERDINEVVAVITAESLFELSAIKTTCTDLQMRKKVIRSKKSSILDRWGIKVVALIQMVQT